MTSLARPASRCIPNLARSCLFSPIYGRSLRRTYATPPPGSDPPSPSKNASPLNPSQWDARMVHRPRTDIPLPDSLANRSFPFPSPSAGPPAAQPLPEPSSSSSFSPAVEAPKTIMHEDDLHPELRSTVLGDLDPNRLYKPLTLQEGYQPPLHVQPTHPVKQLRGLDRYVADKYRSEPIGTLKPKIQIPQYPQEVIPQFKPTDPNPEPVRRYRDLDPEQMQAIYEARIINRPKRREMDRGWVQKAHDMWSADEDDPEGFVTVRQRMGLKTRRDRPGDWMWTIEAIPAEWWRDNLARPLFWIVGFMPWVALVLTQWWLFANTKHRGRKPDGSGEWDLSNKNMRWIVDSDTRGMKKMVRPVTVD